MASTRPAPTCAIELVSPEMAKQWLGLNHRNRRLSDPVVRRICGAIERGEWMVSTDAVGLDSDGGVVNGQHRLTSIVETDTAVELLILRNVDPNIIKIIDQGMGRNFTQLLQMDGRYTYPQVIAGGVEWLYRVVTNFENVLPAAYKATVPQLLELFEAHPNIVASVAPALEVAKLGVNRNLAVGVHYQFASVDPDAAEDFFDRLASGLGVIDGDPVYHLREMIIVNAKRTNGNQAKAPVVGAWIVKAWEATRRGDTVTARNLRWSQAGSKGQGYPKVSGVPWLTTAEETVAEGATV